MRARIRAAAALARRHAGSLIQGPRAAWRSPAPLQCLPAPPGAPALAPGPGEGAGRPGWPASACGGLAAPPHPPPWRVLAMECVGTKAGRGKGAAIDGVSQWQSPETSGRNPMGAGPIPCASRPRWRPQGHPGRRAWVCMGSAGLASAHCRRGRHIAIAGSAVRSSVAQQTRHSARPNSHWPAAALAGCLAGLTRLTHLTAVFGNGCSPPGPTRQWHRSAAHSW